MGKDEAGRKRTVPLGRWTGCELDNTIALTMPWRVMDGRLRPEFSQTAAQLSLELAATAYDLELSAWREAGWRDVSYLVDNELLTGPSANGSGGGLSRVMSAYLQRKARARLTRQGAIGQLRGALRQREASDTCKAVVMLHAAPGGRYVVAVGFMGTGRRIYDWFSNFRLMREDGAHLGFLQLAREFEENCEAIVFPQTAKELGLEQLTLRDIFQECRRPNSRFHIWMAGHSQGGAVMQLVAYRQIMGGLLRQHLIGYGFASPSVLYDAPPCDLSGFPLFHIINADDVTPRVGAKLHIGCRRVLRPDEEMRACCYRAVWQDEAYRTALSMLRPIRDTESALVWVMALLKVLQALPEGESMAMLTGMPGRLLPEKAQESLGGHVDELLGYLIRKAEAAYAQVTGGKAVPQGMLLSMRRQLEDAIARYGALPYVRAVRKALALPHRLRGNDTNTGVAPYLYIVNERFAQLNRNAVLAQRQCAESEKRTEPRTRALPGGRFARFSAQRNLRARRRG